MSLEDSFRNMNISSKLKYRRFCDGFILSNDNPSDILKMCIKKNIDRTIYEAKNKGTKVDRIAVTFSSKLLYNDIHVITHRLTENSADLILNKFENIWQENKQCSRSFFDKPITVRITRIRKKKRSHVQQKNKKNQKNYLKYI